MTTRPLTEMRTLKITPNYYSYKEGSCLIEIGNTKVLCAVSHDSKFVPHHIKGTGRGWISAEYNMLPSSSPERIRRERSKVGGRTQEIQRLIGRSLRSAFDLTKLGGERSFIVDCDVLQADGGTRTASITGAFVALSLALKNLQKSQKIFHSSFPAEQYLSAISVGIVEGQECLDLCYERDSNADVDMNVVMTSNNQIVEVQGTAEKVPFSRTQLNTLLDLSEKGCATLFEAQKDIIGPLNWS